MFSERRAAAEIVAFALIDPQAGAESITPYYF